MADAPPGVINVQFGLRDGAARVRNRVLHDLPVQGRASRLRWLASLPSTDDDATRLARGERNAFAAWTVEDRRDDQLLMIDVHRRTGSWFMLEASAAGTPLYFGSVVFRRKETAAGRELHGTY